MKFGERGRAMRLNIRKTPFIRRGAAVGAMSLAAVAVATGLASTAAAKTPTVDISVASLVPGATAAATTAFNAQVKDFEKANPGIHVSSVQYDWTGPTFAAELAAGTLPTLFTVPFTDGRALGQAGQLANLTPYAKAYPWFKKFNPAVIAEGTDAKGQIIAIPEAAYAQGLQYNRQLFSAAGLNPNKPPTTWAQVESDAQAIAKSNPNVAGFSVMGASDNTAGWILTTLTYAFGGRMETGIGAHAKATFDNPGAVAALNMLHTLRWTDNAMGSNFGLSWGTATRRSQQVSSGCSSAALTFTRTWFRRTRSIRASTAWRRSRRRARTPASSVAAHLPPSSRRRPRRKSRPP